MSTAVAAPMAATTSLPVDRAHSPRQFAVIAPTSASPPSHASSSTQDAAKTRRPDSAPRPAGRSNASPGEPSSRTSPTSSGKAGAPPTIKVKREPGSPSMQSARHRPKRLDLSSSNTGSRGPHTARPSAPLTSRDSAGLGIQDVGLACLSPGFQTNDPGMREQLQRSLDVRDQQRQIIEARQKGTRPGANSHDHDSAPRTQDTTLFGVETRAPITSRRKGPPPGLSISAPSAAQFANDRVVQSAPLNQTFTGLRAEHPYSRHIQHGPSNLGQNSHIHHVPATQTNNRLPPISDVFTRDHLDPHVRTYPPSSHSPAHSSHSNVPPPVPSPGFPPPHHHHAHHHPPPPLSGRAHEFRSADEAMHGLSGGRDDLLPKVVHYGGVQPPTPPSPMHHAHGHNASSSRAAHAASTGNLELSRPDMIGRTASMNGRRRDREEYERDNGSSPSASRPDIKRTTFTVRGDRADRDRDEDWRSGMSSADKREEFLRLCERAWDLFHS